jgi:acyl-CoA synthetase (AMP-forming)/AMP-acid ligase II
VIQGLPAGIVHLKWTSATSGDAREVAFRAEQLVADLENIQSTMGLRRDWPNLGAISMAHSYGFSNLVLPLLLSGVPLVLCGSALPEAVKRGASLVGEATLAGVPALWRTWIEANAVPANVRLAISAGARLPLRLEETAFEKCGLKIHNFYGATECGGIAYDRSMVPRPDPDLAGEALDGVSLSLGESDLLEVRSAAVGEGYWPKSDSRLGSGVYRTADVARLNAGRVYLHGRSGDLIHVAGRKVAPEVIERVLQRCAGVQECLVLGVPCLDDVRTETVAVVFVASPRTTAGMLRAHAMRCLPEWQVPRIWHRVESIQVNERGKLSRRAWRERLAAARPRI